jgi:hypothetical protein
MPELGVYSTPRVRPSGQSDPVLSIARFFVRAGKVAQGADRSMLWRSRTMGNPLTAKLIAVSKPL